MNHRMSIICFILLWSIALPIQAIASKAIQGRDGNIEWNGIGELPIEEKPIDMIPSYDGKNIFVLTANNTILIYDNQGTLHGSIPVEKGVTTIEIARNGQFLFLMDENKKNVSILSVGFIADIDITGSPVRGPLDAPVTIAVYSDFQ